MKKIISLISLLCLSAPIMGMDTSTLYVVVKQDASSQFRPGELLSIENVKISDTMEDLAKKISHNVTMLGARVPIKVTGIFDGTVNLLPGNRSVSSLWSAIKRESPVEVSFEPVVPFGK